MHHHVLHHIIARYVLTLQQVYVIFQRKLLLYDQQLNHLDQFVQNEIVLYNILFVLVLFDKLFLYLHHFHHRYYDDQMILLQFLKVDVVPHKVIPAIMYLLPMDVQQHYLLVLDCPKLYSRFLVKLHEDDAEINFLFIIF